MVKGIIVALVLAGITVFAALTPRIDAWLDAWIARSKQPPRPILLIPEGKYSAPLWRVWCAVCRVAISYHGPTPPHPAWCMDHRLPVDREIDLGEVTL